MIAVFRNDRFDHNTVARHPFFDDAGREFRHLDAGTFSARTFFAFGHAHEPLGRLAVQHFAGVIADPPGFFAAARAVSFAGNDFFDARQILWQWLAAWMRLSLARLGE